MHDKTARRRYGGGRGIGWGGTTHLRAAGLAWRWDRKCGVMRKLFVGLAVAALLTGCAVLFASPVLADTVQVFSWSGGGPSNDIRDSASFTLAGGHQIVTASMLASPGYEEYASGGWTVEANNGSEFEMFYPAGMGTVSSDFYLPAGAYHLGSNTVFCTWTITVSEVRVAPTPTPTPTPTPFSTPVITKIEPTSGPRGTQFTITGTGFLGDRAGLYFGRYLMWSDFVPTETRTDTQITDAVPTGDIVVPGIWEITAYAYHNKTEYKSNGVNFTILPDPSIALITDFKLNGWSPNTFPVVIKLKKSVTARGTTLMIGGTLAGSQSVLTVQKQQAGAWVVVKTASVTISPMKTFRWTYKPAKRGSYCMQAAIVATATNTADETEWFPFRVK